MARTGTETIGPRPGLRERSKQDKLNRIRAAARSLFIEKGYDATTTQEVAHRARIAAGPLFLYARTKEDLILMAFLEDLATETDEAAASVDPAEPLVDQLLHVFDRVLAFHRRDLELSRHLLRESAVIRNVERRGEAIALASRIRGHLVVLLEAGRADGAIRQGIDLDDAAAGIFALHFGLLHEWTNAYLDADEYSAKLRAIIELMLTGLAPPR